MHRDFSEFGRSPSFRTLGRFFPLSRVLTGASPSSAFALRT
jgi:hypothetical protein